MVRVVSLSVLLALIVFLGLMFFQVVAPFLLPLFLAGVTAVLCQPLFVYFLRRTKERVMVSAGVTTTVVLLAILVPLSVGTIMAAAQLYVLSQDAFTQTNWNRSLEWVKHELDFDAIYNRAEPYLLPLVFPDLTVPAPNVDTNITPDLSDDDPPVEAWRPFDPIPEDTPEDVQLALEKIEENIARPIVEVEVQKRLDAFKEQSRTNMQNALLSLSQRTLNFAGATVNTTLDLLGTLITGLLGFIMFAIALFFFLADGPKMLTTMQELIPVHKEYQRELWTKFESVIRAVVLATFMSAICQGLLTALALYLSGFRHFFIIWLLATASSLIPLAGNWIVWGPCAVWLAYSGSWGTAVALALFGILVISTIDNVIKTYVLQSDAKLHPLLAFVSVLGGLKAMGLAGIFVAPVVASCLHALVKIFNAELKAFSKQKFGAQTEIESSSLLHAEFGEPEPDNATSDDAIAATITETQPPSSSNQESPSNPQPPAANRSQKPPQATVKQSKTRSRRRKK
ncbi:MAG: AI-2E family transporter [Planctomycetota bacterium]|nr:AI-2E family transporter [Planctomycetota bacterium]MDA1211787.1 AI-2E family transporter [Planctomycetota bacterium]